MQITISHLDQYETLNNITYNLSYPRFIKHLAFAGFGAYRSHINLFRFLGCFIEYYGYWNDNHFDLPFPIRFDPTEKGQISNRIGKALADFLAKKINRARFTYNYEYAMKILGIPIKGKKPDLYCDTLTQQFAIEAKGRTESSISKKNMKKYKTQSQQGPLPVNFTIASASYDLYSSPKVNYYDPINPDIEYNMEINLQLRKRYYLSIQNLIEFYSLSGETDNQFSDFTSFHLRDFPLFDSFYLIIHKSILNKKWQINGLLESLEKIDKENIFIDLDGIGIKVVKHR